MFIYGHPNNFGMKFILNVRPYEAINKLIYIFKLLKLRIVCLKILFRFIIFSVETESGKFLPMKVNSFKYYGADKSKCSLTY